MQNHGQRIVEHIRRLVESQHFIQKRHPEFIIVGTEGNIRIFADIRTVIGHIILAADVRKSVFRVV